MTSGRPTSEVNVLVKDHLKSNFDAANEVTGIASNSDIDFHTGLFDDSSTQAQVGVPPPETEAPMDTPGSAIDGSGKGVIQYMDGSVDVHVFVNRTHASKHPKLVSEQMRRHIEDLVIDNQKTLVSDNVRYIVPGPRSFLVEDEKDPTLYHRIVPVFYNYDIRPS